MGINQLPDEVLLESLLPCLPVRDLAALSATSKRFHHLANDETLWLQKTIGTFHLSPLQFAPPTAQSGWSKRTFQGLAKPRTFVWGSANNDRLGLPQTHYHGQNFRRAPRFWSTPQELSSQFEKDGAVANPVQDSLAASSTGADSGMDSMKGAGIVELQAGGWSFAARDFYGGVWLWGQMNGMTFMSSHTWSSPAHKLSEPTRLPLPFRAEQISMGRQHLVVLDQDNLIWELQSFGRVYHHTAPSLTSPTNKGAKSYPHHVIQISAGWSHSACLTSDGTIHYWFPMSSNYTDSLTPGEDMTDVTPPSFSTNPHKSVKCGKVGADCVMTLESIPTLSELKGEEADGEEDEAGNKIVKIASGASFVIALRANGQVWLRVLYESGAGNWQYLPAFSGPSITHISAQSEAFTTYSPTTSQVMFARLPEERGPGFFDQLQPEPLPGLQGRGVIQVAIGDHHYSALTNQGEMFTWGHGENGELGHGPDVQNTDEPTRVRFPRETGAGEDNATERNEDEEAFVFSITAAGWHTGALVLGDPRRNFKAAAGESVEEAVPAGLDASRPGDSGEGLRQDQDWADAMAYQESGGLAGPMFRVGFPGRMGFAASGARGGVTPAQRTWRPRQSGASPDSGSGTGQGL